MKYERLLELAADQPIYETGLLLSGNVEPNDVRRQLSRWVKLGRVYQLQRGLYALAPPYQKHKPHSFLIANHMTRGSYVSCQSALAYYGLIPEYTPVTTSVTTQRPGSKQTILGRFEFRHIKPAFFYGYQLVEIVPEQAVFLATPEKALLDLAHLVAGADNSAWLRELRLQNLEQLMLPTLQQFALQADSPKLMRFAQQVAWLVQSEQDTYETL